MANTTTSLDFEKCSSIIERMKENLEKIKKASSTYVAEMELAQKSSSPMKWIGEIIEVGENSQKQCTQVSEALDTLKNGLRKFHTSMNEFVDSSLGADV